MEIQNGGWRLGGCKLKPPHALFSCSLHHALEVDSRFGSQTLRNLKKASLRLVTEAMVVTRLNERLARLDIFQIASLNP